MTDKGMVMASMDLRSGQDAEIAVTRFVLPVQVIVLAAVMSPAAAQDTQKATVLERSSKGWERVQAPSLISPKPRCEVRSPDGRITFSADKLTIYYRGENRSQNGQYQIDNRETLFYGNPTPTGPYFRQIIFQNDDFRRIMRGKRLRVTSILVSGQLERDDIDIAHVKPLIGKLATC